MKQIGLLIRIILVGIIWTTFFTILGRSLIYGLWGFDPAYNKHWIFLWQMWKDGWVIDTGGEWSFFITLLLVIPVWIVGWLLLANIKWGQKIAKVLERPYMYLKRLHRKYFMPRVLVVTRRKSYRKVRPAPLHYVVPSSSARAKPRRPNKPRKDGKDAEKMYARMEELSGKKIKRKPKSAGYIPSSDEYDDDDFEEAAAAAAMLAATGELKSKDDDDEQVGLTRQEILNSLKESSEQREASASKTDGKKSKSGKSGKSSKASEDKTPLLKGNKAAEALEKLRMQPPPAWDLAPEDEEEIEPPTEEEKEALRIRAIEDARDMLKVKGFKVFENVKIGDVVLNFVGLSGTSIVSCYVDSEEGDWLADEDIINEEVPMWFSEQSHRVSPVFLLEKASLTIRKKLGLDERIVDDNILLIEGGNVINAADMEDIWAEKSTRACRIGTGAPVTLPHFMEAVPEAIKPADDEIVKMFKKTFKVRENSIKL